MRKISLTEDLKKIKAIESEEYQREADDLLRESIELYKKSYETLYESRLCGSIVLEKYKMLSKIQAIRDEIKKMPSVLWHDDINV